jgi:hypothetical protein
MSNKRCTLPKRKKDLLKKLYFECKGLDHFEEEVFYKQLDRMKTQDKHRHKSVKDHWEYAYNKITGVQQRHETLLINQNSK